jgi:DNA-binding response OmpR family regulator
MSKILIIEPDYILGLTYRSCLERHGHNVVIVNGAQSGVAAADQEAPDVVLLEIQLVEHSGIEFLYEFRSYVDWQNIPVIIHSQVPISEFVSSWEILQDVLGVQSYLYKPQTSLKQLLSSINALTTQAA